MEKLTKALMTDETGQAIVTKLTALSGQMHELAMATRGSAILFESESDISVLGDGGYLAVYVGSTNPLVISGWTGDNSLVTGNLYYLMKSGTAVTSRDLGEYGGMTVQGGQPTPVTLASQMVDPDTAYLYIGDEDGYDYGYIYAYNGSNFIRLDLYGKGADGYSPQASVSQTPTGASITVVDKNGTSTASVSNGTATDEQVGAWLENHPEATTTVQDGAISNSKLASGIYGRLKTADYGALKRLLSAMLYDTDVESAENVASLINGIIGDKDLGDFMLPDNTANNVRPFAIYSDDGETELYSATSPTDAVFWNNAETIQTEYHITVRTTTTRAWPVYIGEYDPTNKQLNNAVLLSDNFTKNITYSADYTVASGKRLGVVCIGGFLGSGGTKGHGGTYESLTIYKKIV